MYVRTLSSIQIPPLTRFLGSFTFGTTAEITSEGIFKSHAGLGEDNLPIIPINCLPGLIHLPEGCRPIFHTSFEGVGRGGKYIFPRLPTSIGHNPVDETHGLYVHNSRANDQYRNNI